MVFPTSNLPSVSQPWGREVQKRTETLESLFATDRVNNAARDKQLADSLSRLNTAVVGVSIATTDAALAAKNANDAITAITSLGTTGSTYTVNAGNINGGTVTGITIRGNTIETAATGSRVVMDSAGLRAYNSGGSAVLNFTTSNGNLAISGYITAGNAASDINNNTTTISGTKITTGTLSADKISAGSITASSINLTSSTYQLTVGTPNSYAYLNVYPDSANGVTLNAMGFQSTSSAGWWSNMYPYLNNSVYCGLQAYAWAGIRSVTAVVVTSDERTKNSITDSDLGLTFIDSLRPVSYKFNVGHNEITFDDDGQINGSVEVIGKRKHYGLIAQEVKQTLDNLNVDDFGGWILDDMDDPDSTQGLRYEELIAPMIKAIQELSARVKQLEGN